MDKRKIAHHANLDVMGLEIFDRHGYRGLLEKAGAIDQRLVGIGTIEVVGENFVETFDVGILDGIDVVAIEAGQFCEVVSHGFSPFLVIPGRAPARTRNLVPQLLDSGFEASPRPGMTINHQTSAAVQNRRIRARSVRPVLAAYDPLAKGRRSARRPAILPARTRSGSRWREGRAAWRCRATPADRGRRSPCRRSRCGGFPDPRNDRVDRPASASPGRSPRRSF